MTAAPTVDQLAVLVREYLLCGHLIDRASMPHIIGSWDLDEMQGIAIDEWMGASPVYTRRMQRLLGFQGTDVATIFKGMQLDIGAPPQFMDFRYRVHDDAHGEFWLDHCGALMDVEPMGDTFVVAMCHHIEDPTFDATACATNPRARMRPMHRPPRTPADRFPHCHWTVDIEADADPVPEPAAAVVMAATAAGQLPLPVATDEGRHDYAGALEDDLDLTSFSAGTLAAIADEVALQGHLLSLSGLLSIAARHGDAAAAEVGRHQLTGVAGVTAARLKAALGLGASLADAATVLAAHPAFLPRAYVDLRVDLDADAGTLHVALVGGPALDDPTGLTWPQLLAADPAAEALDAIVQAVDPHLRCRPVESHPGSGVVAAWDVVRVDEAAELPTDVTLTRFSTGADFAFTDEGTRVALRATRPTP